MEFKYTVTVIVPVYNAEKSIGRTMESLFQQTMPQDQVEIILIDDGSTDGSPRICDKYAEEHDNVRVIHQENKGVSAARNAGIQAAQGKYLLYLDSDDTLSPETIKNTSGFFDLHYYDIDVVSYPIAACYDNGRKEYHYRSEIMTRTGIYDVKKTLYINLTTVNVLAKNRGSKNILFDEARAFHEDEEYLTKLVMNSGKIGYVKSAEYRYQKHDESVSSRFSNPYYIFDSSITLYEKLFLKYSESGKVNTYIQTLVLNDFNWKIVQEKFFPYHYTGDDLQSAVARIQALVNKIDSKIILGHPQMNISYKYYLLSLKSEGRPFACADALGLKIIDYSGELNSQRSILTGINHLEISSSGMYILAYLKCFAFDFTEARPQAFAVLPDNTRKKLELFPSQHSQYWTNFETNRFYAFQFSTDNLQFGRIQFEVSLFGNRYATHFWYPAKGRVHPDIGCNYLEGHSNSLLCKKDSLEIVPTNTPALLQEKHNYEKSLFKSKKKQWLARRLMKSFQPWRTWLYFDSHDSLDNGYYQFLHDIEKKDGVHRYYVYHADNLQLIQGKFSGRAGRALIPFGSVRHKCLMASAEKILTSFSGRSCFLPFDPDTYQYYSDLFHYEVIYLQHGVMHAKLPNMYSKEKVWQVNQIVVSTRFEKENLLQLGYREKDILTSGMPRLDHLRSAQSTGAGRRILFAPSWRRNLVRTVDGVQSPIDSFYHSEYYSAFSSFLEDKGLHQLLKKYDLYVDVQIHPMFSCYAESFLSVKSDRIQMIRFANVADYLACITDFSSFLFDFVYMDKPVISYFPDREAFRAGTHTYSDFYYPLEDGFALYCEDKKSAIEFLGQLCEDNFSLPPKLASRARELYFNREANHREELYHTLIGDR